MELISRLGLAVSVFASTNVDDLFLLAGYFSTASLRPRSIVAGQFLGIGALIAASIVATLAAIALPGRWVALLRDLNAIPLYVAVFALMTAVWCLLGSWLVNNPWMGPPLRRYGRIVLPFVLIALGLYILLEGFLY